MTKSREIQLVRRPQGLPRVDDFAVVEVATPDAGPGEVLLQAELVSVDPYMRPRLNADQPLNVPMLGTGLARVVQSRHPGFKEGDLARHGLGMRERFAVKAEGLEKIEADPGLPLSVHMHVLGMTGITAYGGLLEIGALRDGEQVFVSTAAGAVGSVAAQIAKIRGCYVVGSTGSDDKAAWLRDALKLDAVINYRTQPLAEVLAQVTPKGIDVYFENVGGDHLEAALTRMNLRGRIPVCGTIASYNGDLPGVRNLGAMIYGRIRMQGFVSSDFAHLRERFHSDMTAWLKAGELQYQETVLDGFERAPEALIGLFEGRNIGKMLVRAV